MEKKGIVFNRQQMKRYMFLVVVILLLFIVFSFVAPGFFSVRTFFNIIRQNVVLAVLSLGITFIIMLAGTDLSSGANIAVSAVCAALVIQAVGGGTAAAVCGYATAILVGMLAGTANGIMIGILGISPFMATLAMTSVSRGMATYLSDSKRIVVENDAFNYFGQKNIIGDIPASLIYLLDLFLVMNLI